MGVVTRELAQVSLALLPTAVRYSQEVRMYAWLGLWLLGAPLALVYWVCRPECSRYLTAFALGLALALLALIVGVEGLGLLNNYTVDPNDQFDTMVD